MQQTCWIKTAKGLSIEVGRKGVCQCSAENQEEGMAHDKKFVTPKERDDQELSSSQSQPHSSDTHTGSGSDDAFLAEIDRCCLWFSQAHQSNPPTVNSFWLQQFLIHWSGESLSQGAVIIAAFRSGFAIDYEPESQKSSVTIGVSNESISQFDCGCGHP